MDGVTRKYKIRNEHVGGTTRVPQGSKNITERILNWYGHVTMRGEEHYTAESVKDGYTRKRKRGRPKTRWKDACVNET